jgi:hypothetical protein
VPDGIERAEPTLAPSRHRLTTELVKSRFHHISPNLKRRAHRGNQTWDSFYFLISKMSSHFSFLPKIVRNALFLASLAVSPLRQFDGGSHDECVQALPDVF